MPTLYTDRPKNGYHLVITMIKRGAVTLIIHDTSYDILIKIVALLEPMVFILSCQCQFNVKARRFVLVITK
jgi:hypothetical protein